MGVQNGCIIQLVDSLLLHYPVILFGSQDLTEGEERMTGSGMEKKKICQKWNIKVVTWIRFLWEDHSSGASIEVVVKSGTFQWYINHGWWWMKETWISLTVSRLASSVTREGFTMIKTLLVLQQQPEQHLDEDQFRRWLMQGLHCLLFQYLVHWFELRLWSRFRQQCIPRLGKFQMGQYNWWSK